MEKIRVGIIGVGRIGTPHLLKISSRDPEIPPEKYIKHSKKLLFNLLLESGI